MASIIERKKAFKDNPSINFLIQNVEGEAGTYFSGPGGGEHIFRLTIFFPAMKQVEIINLLDSENISISTIHETSLLITSNTMEYVNNALTLLQYSGLINPGFVQDIIQNFPNQNGDTLDLSRSDYRQEQENSLPTVSAERPVRISFFNDARRFVGERVSEEQFPILPSPP